MATRVPQKSKSVRPLKSAAPVPARTRYLPGRCHVCGKPQKPGALLCPEHDRMWQAGQLRLTRRGAERARDRGMSEVMLFVYGEPQGTVRRSGRPKRRDASR